MTDVKFKVGDVVQLKSGGPYMTVEVVSEKNIGCTWFIDDKGKGYDDFIPITLQNIPAKIKKTHTKKDLGLF